MFWGGWLDVARGCVDAVGGWVEAVVWVSWVDIVGGSWFCEDSGVCLGGSYIYFCYAQIVYTYYIF